MKIMLSFPDFSSRISRFVFLSPSEARPRVCCGMGPASSALEIFEALCRAFLLTRHAPPCTELGSFQWVRPRVVGCAAVSGISELGGVSFCSSCGL